MLALCLPLLGCQQWFPQTGGTESRAYQQYRQGQQLFQQKKYKQALGVFLKLQSQQPDQLELMYNLGTVYYRLGKGLKKKNPKREEYLKKAKKYLTQVSKEGSAQLRHKAHYNLGLVHTEQKQYDQALVHFSSAANIARQTLKQPDADADHNRDQLAMLIRQRERKREKLNRTRVFRYAPKVIKLKASKAYADPIRDIALRATFTHKTTNQTLTVWGAPLSHDTWEVRFVPTRTGKWSYKIESVVRTTPGRKTKTQKDPSLRDEGLFRVLPSARAGQLVVAGGNAVRFAWKKPKEEVKTKVKAKGKGKPGAKGTPAPKGKGKAKGKGKTKGKAKKPDIPKDETIVRWQGLHIPTLFSPALSDKRFQKHHQMLELIRPSAVVVDLPLDKLFRWEDKKPLRTNKKAFDTLVQRLKIMRQNPTYRWVFVYNISSDTDRTPTQLQHALGYLVGRLAHVDAIWSLHQLEGKARDFAVGFLRGVDPYRQPIAVAYDEALAQRIDRMTPKQRKALQTKTPPPSAKATTRKANKGKGKTAKSTKKKAPKTRKPTVFRPNPKTKHLVWHTSHHVATGKAIQGPLLRPWIGDLPLPVELAPEALRKQWWKLYIAGISTTVVLDRALHDDELNEIIQWQRKANDVDTLPPHPDQVAASTAKGKGKTADKKAPTTRPVARRASPAPRRAAPSPRVVARPTPKRPQVRPAPRARAQARTAPRPRPIAARGTPPTKRKVAKRTPKDERISRPVIHLLRVRHSWDKFLDSFRFSGYVRPSLVRVMMPDLTALRKWRQRQQKKTLQLPNVRLQPPGTRKDDDNDDNKKKDDLQPPSRKGSSKRFGDDTSKLKAAPTLKRPTVQWKPVNVRGYLATNGPTVLFVPPSTTIKKPPVIRWRQSRWDLEFRWYNAETATFLKKKVFRQVTSLALTAPEKKAHVAKVSVRDHKQHDPYSVALPPKLFKQVTTQPVKRFPLRLKDWKLVVQAPKRPQQKGARPAPPMAQLVADFVRTQRGYVARFQPNRQGVWSFRILHKGKPLQGMWKFPGKIKVVPSTRPARLQRQRRNPMVLRRDQRPYFLMTKSIPGLLSERWTPKQFDDTLKQFAQRYPGVSVIVTTLPSLSWRSALPTSPKKAPSTRPARAASAWSPDLVSDLQRLERRLKALHEAGYYVALVAPKSWSQLSAFAHRDRIFYLLDRFASAYPLLWIDERSQTKAKAKAGSKKLGPVLPMLVRAWYLQRFPQVQKALRQAKGKKRPNVLPSLPPPLIGAHLGRPKSEKQLKAAAKRYDWLWLNVDALEKEIKDFNLTRLGRPVVLTWRPLTQPTSPFRTKASAAGKGKKKSPWDTKAVQRWASFLWRAQMFGFAHADRPLQGPLAAPPTQKGKTPAKAKPSPPQRVVQVLRGFFSTFDWSALRPPARSIKLRPFEAFGAENPIKVKPGKKGKPQVQLPRGGHHLVAWVKSSVRQYLQIQRSPKVPLKKHRYLWINPMSGEQPVSPQLLPPQPAKGQRDQLQVPFQPAVLYVFRRPPQKGRPRPQRRRRKQKDRNASKRQQIRNQVRNLRDNRFDRRKKRRRQRSLTGKRG